MSTSAESILGKRFGKLQVIEIAKRDNQGRPIYKCICDCGNECYPRKDSLNRRKDNAHCGCRKGLTFEESYKERCEKQKQKYALKKQSVSKANKEYRLRKYGISIEIFNQMLAAQSNRCSICKVHTDELPKTYNTLVVDHCHQTGKVRSLLCSPCNTALGLFREEPESLTAAIEYLKRHK